MLEVIDPNQRRQLGSCFYLPISLQQAEDDIREAVANSIAIERATKLMLDGSMSFEDLLEAIEEYIPDMDDYVEEVEENLTATLLYYPQY